VDGDRDAWPVTVAWLWLYGPTGVGKSATGFELFERLAARGERVAFVELDQIGMCMPAPGAVRSAAKADNLLAMLDNFEAAGAHGAVVCGDVVETMRDLLGRAPARPVLCRLRATDAVTRERLTIRESLHWAMSAGEYESYDVPVGDLDITTYPLGVREVADEILYQLGPWPPRPSPVTEASPPSAPATIEDAPAVLVTGPRAVGTSTAAWQVFMAGVEAGQRTGYLDLDQLGFLAGAQHVSSLATKLANVAACYSGFRAHGAERLVLCGHVNGEEIDAVRTVLRSITVVALTAGPETLRLRALRRRRHKEIWLPGDDLYGSGDDHVRQIVTSATGFDPSQADLVINTDHLTPAEIADVVTRAWRAATTT